MLISSIFVFLAGGRWQLSGTQRIHPQEKCKKKRVSIPSHSKITGQSSTLRILPCSLFSDGEISHVLITSYQMKSFFSIILENHDWKFWHLLKIKNAGFVLADWILSLNPAVRSPRLLLSPVVVPIQSCTPLLESLTSNRTASHLWLDSLRERHWTKQETKRVGSREKTI